MTNTEIIERVKRAVAECAVKGSDPIRLDDHLEHDLGMNSLNLAELELNIESDFCLDIEGQSSEWATVADVCDSVAKALSTPA
jgi:acyl carrier protein